MRNAGSNPDLATKREEKRWLAPSLSVGGMVLVKRAGLVVGPRLAAATTTVVVG